MKILTDKTIIKMKREIMTKMYNACVEVYETTYPHKKNQAIPDKHEWILDRVITHFHNSPTGEVVYHWINTPNLENLIKK